MYRSRGYSVLSVYIYPHYLARKIGLWFLEIRPRHDVDIKFWKSVCGKYIKTCYFHQTGFESILYVCHFKIKTRYLTLIIVALDTGTNFPAVSIISLFAILMTKLRQRMKGTGAPTQSQPQAASLTLSACNVAIELQ
jgi:hypothetical protein